MDFVEAEGGSIDEAIQRALELLGVTRERVEIEILSHTTRGVFGLGGRTARVRATLRRSLGADESAPSPGGEASAPASRAGGAAEPEGQAGTPAEAGVSPEVLDRGREVLQEILRRIGVDVTVAADPSGREARLAISGDPGGLLIGRHGQTLDALEYVLNLILARVEDGPGRISVDSENYRVRRRQGLEELARRMADRARERGKPVTMNPMNPRDRRIVHLALQNDPSVSTRSTGEGALRRLVIVPRGGGRRDRSRPGSAAL